MKIHYHKTGLMLLLLMAIFACKNNTSQADTKIIAPIKVATARVQQQDIAEYHTFNGITRYQEKEDIRANITGYISWMPFERGDQIKRGQAFASIRTKEQDALKEAVKIDSSLARFSKAQQLTSNATGVLSKIKVVPNDYVAEGDVLATVSQPNTLVVQVSVPFEYTDKIHPGTACEILVPGRPGIHAEIGSALTSLDSIGQARHYLINLPDQELPENLNVQVKVISSQAKNALTIPHEALQTNELLTDFWVMKISGDSLAVKKSVTPLLENDSLVQIESPEVKVNDMVVTQGSYQMQDSTRVSIEKQ